MTSAHMESQIVDIAARALSVVSKFWSKMADLAKSMPK